MLPVDFTVSDLNMLSLENVERLADLAPWGVNNPPPILSLNGARIDSITPIGGDRHLKCKIQKGAQAFECIFFGTSGKSFHFKQGNYIDVAFEPIVNDFRGVRSVQLIVRDARRQVPQRRFGRAYNTVSSVEGDSFNLCRRFLDGEELNATDKFLLRPERADLAMLWKQIEADQERLVQSMKNKIDRLTRVSGLGNPAKTYIGLKIFEELGLIDINEEIGAFEITLRYQKGGSKVDLAASEILKQLQ